MKFIKRKGMAMGLAATLVISPFFSSVTYAAEQPIEKCVYPQLEKYQLQDQNFTKSNLTKEEKATFSENQLIIKYSSPLSTNDHRKAGGKLVKRISSLGYDVVEVEAKDKLEAVAKGYASLVNVQSITRSAFGKTLGTVDPKSSSMYHLDTLNLNEAHALAGKNKVKVGVIDTGLDASHPELKNKLVANINIMDPMKKGSADTHGTHVAGIIAAEKDNGIGGYGVAPNSEIVTIDVSNRSIFVTDYVVAEGVMEAIRQDVKVINMSLGFYFPSPILEDAVQKAIDAGIVVVAAAGNDGASILNYPASFDGVISVGATDDKDELAFFSTFGPSVDVVAPGHNIYAPVFDIDKGSSFVKMSGTSMASPIVAGTVSLLLSKYPNLTPYEVNYMLTKTAKDIGDKGYDHKYGYGLVDPTALLSFDVADIPVDPTVKDEDALEEASDLGSFAKKDISGEIKALNQTDYYSIPLEKNEYVQTALTGTNKYDMKFDLLFFEDGELIHSNKVNDVSAGMKEGALFQAPENGTLVVAVKDSFGKFDPDGKYTYKLALEKTMEFHDDENSMESPIEVASFPYQSAKQYFKDKNEEDLEEFGGIPGDSDFFRFKVPGQEEDGLQTIKLKISDVPGIDSSLVLHYVEEIDGEKIPYELEHASNKSYGAGETLIFNAVPGEEYILEVTNTPYMDEFMALFEGIEIDYGRSYSSLIPYQLSIETRILPPDEDGLPFGEDFDYLEDYLVEGEYEQFIDGKKALKETIISDSEDIMLNDDIEMIKEAAISIKEDETKEGFIQSYGDEDWYAYTPKHSSIFEVKVDPTYPVAMSVLKFDEDSGEMMILYSNEQLVSFDEMSYSTSFMVGLQAGETYYFQVADPMYSPSFDKYKFSIKTKVRNTADSFESNDTFEHATEVSTSPINGNFSNVSDMDMYYFNPGKDGVYNVRVTPQALPKKYQTQPAILKSEIDPVIVIIKDSNGNGVLETEEEGNLILVDYKAYSEEERTGLRTEAESGYFIWTFDYFGTNSSLVPYTFRIDETNLKDEDEGSKVTNNVPSKPVSLSKNQLAKGYLNLTSNHGDSDYYKFNLVQDKTVKVTLEVPHEIDGKVTIYSEKGKQVAVVDTYGKGDPEIQDISLTKGKYYLKIEDVFGTASTEKYILRIQQ